MTSTLARLEKKRFIRVVPDPIDGRAKRIFLTDQGRAAREDAVKAALPLLSEAKLALSRDRVIGMLPDLRVLRSWLDQNRLA
jgi:DNA-binding MarR family transcriptional regulator